MIGHQISLSPSVSVSPFKHTRMLPKSMGKVLISSLWVGTFNCDGSGGVVGRRGRQGHNVDMLAICELGVSF